MRILTQSGARHFCQNFSASTNTPEIEVGTYLDRFRSGKTFAEGTPEFDDLRDCLLRDSERFAFLAAANFASTYRSLQACSAPWSVVGFYYTSFFAARSLLGMNGGWVDADRRWIDVTNLTPGSIELTYRRTKHTAIPNRHGTHKAFWAVFYHAARILHPYAAAQHAYALAPVQSSTSWLIDNRNKLNYGSAAAAKLVAEFLARFDAADVPNTLPGDLKVCRNIALSLLALVHQFRTSQGLTSDMNIGGAATLTDAIDLLVRQSRPPEIDTYCDTTLVGFAA